MDRNLNINATFTNSMGSGIGAASGMMHNFFASSMKGSSLLNESLKVGGMAVATIIGGAGAIFAGFAKQTMDFEKRLVDIKVAGNLSTREMLNFGESIKSASVVYGESRDDIATMTENFIKTSRNAGEASKNVDFFSMMLKTSNVSADELGSTLGDLQRETGATGKDFKNMVAGWYAATKMKGAETTWEKLLPSMRDVVTKFKAANPHASFKDIQKYVTASIFTTDPEAMRKASDYMTPRLMKDPRLLKELTKLGITNVNKASVLGVMEKVMTQYKSTAERGKALGDIFGMKTATSLMPLLENWAEFQEAAARPDVGRAQKDASEKAATLGSKWKSLTNTIFNLAEPAMTSAVQQITDMLAHMTPEEMAAMKNGFQAVADLVVTIAGAMKTTFEILGKIAEWSEKRGMAVSHWVHETFGERRSIGHAEYDPKTGKLHMVDYDPLFNPYQAKFEKEIPKMTPEGKGEPLLYLDIHAQFPGQPEQKATAISVHKQNRVAER